MATYAYKGRDKTGAQVSGTVELSSQNAVANELVRQGITPISISEQADKSASSINIEINIFPKKVALEELIIFCRQMYALSKAGIPIMRALKGLAESTHSELLGETILDVVSRLESGINLASAMQAHPKVFSELFVSMIHVGENTGRLDEAFKELSSNLELERDTRKRVKQATRYPTFVLSAIFIALMVVNLFVIPQFSSVFAKLGADLPVPTMILMVTSEFCLNYWWLILGIIVGAILWFRRWVNTEEGEYIWDKKRLTFPIVGTLFEQIALSRFTRNLAMMLSSGMAITHAIAIAGEASGNKFIASRVNQMRTAIERGDSLLRAANNADIFTPLVIQMMGIGEETGNIDALLTEVADFYDEEADYQLTRLSESIEPILIVAMGGIVLILALGVFLPIWDLGQAAMG